MTGGGHEGTQGWHDPAQVEWYLARMDRMEARASGEKALIEAITTPPRRVLDLGCGDGRVGELVASAYPDVVEVVAVDRSEAMLVRARERLTDPRFRVAQHDLADSIVGLGRFDAVVSGFAIHHVTDDRKRDLFAEVNGILEPGGVFVNLEVVASSTPRRHSEFLEAIGQEADDPEDRLASVEDQLAWMRDAGLIEVECLWRWRGFAVLAGEAAPGLG